MLLTVALTATSTLILSTLLLLLTGKRLRFASRAAGVLAAAVMCVAGAWGAARLWGFLDSNMWASAAITGAVCLVVVLALPHWNPAGQVFMGSYLAAAGSYVALGAYLTAAPGLSLWGRVASLLLLILEILALIVSGYFAFEGCDRLCRARATRRVMAPDPSYLPLVSLQVPAYNEPADMLIETIKSLERIDYPRLEILVVDNNTEDPQVWQPVADYCSGRPRVRFVHIDAEGFKAGALNLVMAEHLSPEVEIIGVVDADYQVDPHYLRETVGYFADQNVAFVQTPQDYREYEGDAYLTACYDAYSYFFHASMPSRNERNSIIFAGTMGLIRRQVLEKLGGWPEWCITEDSETSLRMLKAGYAGVYVEQSMGRGIMPLTFAALKSQRFRWCFGGIQILRKHWRSLLPGKRTRANQLTLGQRLDYVFGTGLVWFNDVLYLGFTAVLLVTAYLTLSGQGAFFRPLFGALVLLPAALLVSGLFRALWSLRQLTGIGVKRSLLALLNWLSMSWTVSLATSQGMVRKRAVFMRTPKEAEHQTVWSALGAAKAETVLALVLWAAAVASAVTGTVFLTLLFLWQGTVYASAPFMSWLSTRTVLSPQLQERRRTEAARERMAALFGYYATGAAALAAVALVAAIFLIGGVQPGRIPALPELPRDPAKPPLIQIDPSPSVGPSVPGTTPSPGQTATPGAPTTTPPAPTTGPTTPPPATTAPATTAPPGTPSPAAS
ncbi:glycosyltransferase [Catelliglobosispora koreensis]|uniref:glycosyltransferase n=1 Tax=Catelliglobosispora koreensis TaxID=129052 RepID=UPI000361BF51|nr:glycosyltransferase [Catelliglobosispora koreensis]